MTIKDSGKFREWTEKMGVRGEVLAEIYKKLDRQDNSDALVAQALRGKWSAAKMLSALPKDTPPPKPVSSVFSAPEQAVEVSVAPAGFNPMTAVPTLEPAPEVVGSAQPQGRARSRREKRAGKAGGSVFGGIKKLFFADKTADGASSDASGSAAAASNKPAGKKWVTIVIVAVLVLVLAIAASLIFANGGGGGYDFSGGGNQTINPSLTPTMPTEAPLSQAEQNDQAYWSNLVSSEVKELSPGNMGNQLSANTFFGLVLVVILSIESWGEGAIRRKSQQGSTHFTVMGLLAGWLTMPILIWASKVTQPGWVLIGVSVIVYLWTKAASTIKSQSDLTPFLTTCAVFISSLFYVGNLTFITTLGSLFGQTWTAWTGVTTFGGIFTLLLTGRGVQALLTIFIWLGCVMVLSMAGAEVGKKHGPWASVMIAVAIGLIFGLLHWGLTAGVEYLVAQGVSVTMTVVLNVLAPILAWVGSILGAVGIGVAMGDTEVGRAENRQRLGLEKSGTFMQNIGDFLILGTLIPLFFGVILIFI